ncbi:hypothetical protein Y032_0038g3580 [Ancylostoma ceylanicum]|uniref:Uncharacterized protein n=1 Tax=Ancylostoma ceylanicum TaxID=53326 RepID=A0A016UKK2_9BILA|nr:hypothetical protein Y032_0038g3580 [Ancylostoma ceylanicum]
MDILHANLKQVVIHSDHALVNGSVELIPPLLRTHTEESEKELSRVCNFTIALNHRVGQKYGNKEMGYQKKGSTYMKFGKVS